MFDLSGMSLLTGLWIGVSVVCLILIQYCILHIKRLSQRVSPFALSVIGVMIFIRLIIPFKLSYTHSFIYRGIMLPLVDFVEVGWLGREGIIGFSFLSVIELIWLTGSVIKVVQGIYSHRKVLSFVMNNSEDITSEIEESRYLTIEQKKMVRQKGISFRSLSLINSPQTCGIFHPIILLPKEGRDDCAEEAWKFAISHELLHVKRRDIVAKFVLYMLRLVYWWIPFSETWGANCDIVAELYVDKECSIGNETLYMESILSMMKKTAGSKRDEKMFRLNPVALYSGERQMAIRFDKMMNYKKQSRVASAVTIALSFAIFINSYIFSVVPGIDYAKVVREDETFGTITPTPHNAKIVKNEDGTYTVFLHELEIETVDNLELYDKEIPLYDKKGNRIKWPFLHK